MEKVQIEAAPARLLNAVASMGYDPEVALCDLIDNSIDAEAKNIHIHLILTAENNKTRSSIEQYIICDDGFGMNNQELRNAFTLGSIRDYPKHALGKFGIGMKSASLALANKIVVITKKSDMQTPLCGILSKKHVETSGKYEIDLGEIPPKYQELYQSYKVSDSAGTILILDDLNESPYADFTDYFLRYCGIVYHLFLNSDKSLTMQINSDSVVPIDPLFIEEAQKNGDLEPLNWSGRIPHILIKPDDFMLDDESKCKIAATHLVHPPTFDKEGKRAEARDQFYIEADPYTKRPRHGFYIYRNKRVIVMGELFRGIVSREQSAWAFRARLMFDESSDKVMSLDVKKRHCQLPPKARQNLKNLVQYYHAESINAWKEAGKKATAEKRRTKEEMANEGIASSRVSKADYIPPGLNIDSEADLEKRKQRQQEVAKEALKAVQDVTVSEDFLEQAAKDKKLVIPVDGLKSNAMWDVRPASSQIGEVQALVNKYNSWVEKSYAEAEENPALTIILHQFFYVLARAELEVKTNQWRNLPPHDKIEKVFDKFRLQASYIAESLADALEEQLDELRSNSGKENKELD